MRKNLLHITNELNTVDGVTNHVYVLLKSLSESYGGNVFVLSGGGNNSGVFENTNVTAAVNPLLNHKNRTVKNYASAVRFLRKFIRENNIGIIHSHNHYAANIASYASKLSDVVTVQTNHGMFPDKGRLKLFNADYYVALNRHVLVHILEKGIPGNSVRLIKPGIPDVAHEIPKEKNTFLAASRFSKEKGLEKYIIAANKITSAFPGKYKFFIAGEGEEEGNLKKLNRDKGNAVEFVADYQSRIASSEVFVFPTEAKEGLPTVLLEAVFSGCVVVSSAYKGVEDLFPHPYDDLLAAPGDAVGLMEKMIYAAGNPASLLKRYEELYGKIKRDYSVSGMVSGHLDLYGSILR